MVVEKDIVAISIPFSAGVIVAAVWPPGGDALWAVAAGSGLAAAWLLCSLSGRGDRTAAMLLLYLLLGVMCGCAGSTSGGLKADRIVVLLKSIGRQINRILHPSSVNEVRFGGKILRDQDVAPHVLYIALYVVLLAFSATICLLLGVGWQNSLAASVTSISNVGPALGDMGSMGTFNGIPVLAKLVYTFDMFLGRIEIYPVLAVVAMIFDKRNR